MSGMKIRKLLKDEEDEFKELTRHYIGLWYDDIDESFPQMILDAHNAGSDPIGYFTKNKNVWVADLDGKMAGFLVGTEKRGGSVKLLPGIMKPEYQQKGIGTSLWLGVEDIYRNNGFRKVYNHAPINRLELLKWVTSMGLTVEAHLKEQYRKNQNEYVAGKLLRRTPHEWIEPVRWENKHSEYSIRGYRDSDSEQLEKLVLGEMPRWYDQIDTSFVESIIAGEKRFGETFKKKGKKVFLVESEGNLVGCCIATPKRGRSVKLVPYILSPSQASYRMGEDLLNEVEGFFSKAGYRKLYAPIPVYDLDACRTLRRSGFEPEGLIREPYKDNVDNLFLGKFIDGT